MNQDRNTFAARGSAALAALLTMALSACSGGGGSSNGGSFRLLETNISTNQNWAINRTMTFEFSDAVDLNSVSLNTISITRVGGGPASGSFSLLSANTVAFQPSCPTQDDFLDAGLQPGGVHYSIDVVATSTGGLTVRSVRGDRLTVGLTTEIVTPESTDLAELFDDTQIGPPSPLVWDGVGSVPTSGVSYLEEGGDANSRIVLKTRTDASASALGAEPAVANYTAPLNLYSAASSALAVVVLLDQPIDPSASNVNPQTVRLQYCSALDGSCGSGSSGWIDLAHDVELEANCVNGGSSLRVTPIGILPLGRLVRVSLASSFRDLVGNSNLLDLPVASFFVSDGTDPDTGLPVTLQDEFLEPFNLLGTNPDSTQDPDAVLDAPLAKWGENGTLTAGFEFGGTGGPGGVFDWRIVQLAGGGATVLNTIFSTITNATQTASQTVVNGQVDVRDMTVDSGGLLEIRGSNACVIRASGNVTINGKIRIRGTSNAGVTTFSTGNLQEPGAAGNGGGGRGGTGNVLTTQSSPVGEAGVGAFDVLGAGGGGGETGYSNLGINQKRGAGGGGGSLGKPMVLLVTATPFNPNGCPNQTIIGLDAEDGNPGGLGGNGAIGGAGQRPQGGAKGPRPFFDSDPNNDFFGLMRVNGATVRGELDRAWAGAGGGGGGNSVPTNSFPNPAWTFATDDKGSGGGGGGGSLTILCLGDVIFGMDGRIDAGGGTGGGGENSSGINRVGSASGGGSGGHVIIQVGKTIDFRLVRTNQTLERNRGGIWTRGGQGGAGREDVGGAHPGGDETTPTTDRLPRDHYAVANGGIIDPAPCAVAATGNTALGFGMEGIAGAGGDGGPGIIQLHAPTLADILVPTMSGETLTNCLRPNPVGSTITFGGFAGTSNVNTPAMWNQMLPGFGRISKAQSKWIPLGSTSVSPTSTTPEATEFLFGGVDGAGLILKTGAGANATQFELPSVLNGSGSQAIVAAPGTPYITADKRTVVFDGTTFTDDVYLTNPSLLRLFDVRIVSGAGTTHFEAASATYDSMTGLVRVTVGTSGMPLNAVLPDGSSMVSLRPRFFRVRTAGVEDSLPDPASVKFEFQATTANSFGQPNTGGVTAWVTDITQLNIAVNNPSFRFLRFRVTFDLGLTNLTTSTPVPSVEFLRVPFRF